MKSKNNIPVGLLGRGYLGQRLWPHLPPPSWCTTRQGGSGSLVFDLAQPASWANLPQGQAHLVMTLPPTQAEPEAEAHLLQAWGQWMQQHRPQQRRLLYISTTGVYPEADGLWSEDQAQPDHPKGKMRLACELSLGLSFDLQVIRAGAIYGPGRHLAQRLQQGQEVPIGPQKIHRIHVDDLARLVLFLLDDPNLKTALNALDLNPCSSLEVAQWLIQQPQAASWPPLKLSEGMQLRPSARGQEVAKGRVISAQRLLDSGFVHLYPTFQEGFAQIFAEEQTP